jgi:hypothetical protein
MLVSAVICVLLIFFGAGEAGPGTDSGSERGRGTWGHRTICSKSYANRPLTGTDGELRAFRAPIAFRRSFGTGFCKPNRPEMRGHAASFENERLCKLLNFLAFRLSVRF